MNRPLLFPILALYAIWRGCMLNVHALFHGSMRRTPSDTITSHKPEVLTVAAPRPEPKCSKPECGCSQTPGRRMEEQRRAS